MIKQIIPQPAMAVENFNVPQAIPTTMTDKMYEVSSVSLRIFRKRTIANTAISPNAVTRLFDRTSITIETMVGMTTSELTKEREYDNPEWVNM